MAIAPVGSPSWRSPAELDTAVTTSMRPGTSGRPCGSYAGPSGALDWPLPPMYRICEIGRDES